MKKDELRAIIESLELSNEALRTALGDESVALQRARQENRQLASENAAMRTHRCSNLEAEQAVVADTWQWLGHDR